MSTATTTKKPIGRRPRSKKEDEQDSPVQETKQESPIEIQNWSEEVKKNDVVDQTETKQKSVVDFDREEVAKFESKQVSELSVPELLKVLIRRGEDQKNPNPIVSGGCERLLRQISRERMNNPVKHFDKDSGFRGQRGGFRGFHRGGGYRGRGGFNQGAPGGHDGHGGPKRFPRASNTQDHQQSHQTDS